jgi:hypothetical protein
MNKLKWTGTILCLFGILLTSLNIYPLNILIGFIGSGLWALAGYMQDDTPLFVVEIVAVVFYFSGIVLYLAHIVPKWDLW